MTWRRAVSVGLAGLCLMALTSREETAVHAQPAQRPVLVVRPAPDFEVTGKGDHAAWGQDEWTALRRREPAAHPYESRF
jgi:hypothetical protein